MYCCYSYTLCNVVYTGMDHTGFIRYNDFLAAGLMSLGPSIVLADCTLKAVFDKFDRGHNGWITVETLTTFLGQQITRKEVSHTYVPYSHIKACMQTLQCSNIQYM
jgi:hypothetical protein